MKVFEVKMTVRVPDNVDEKLLGGSIVDDAIRSFDDIVEIAYEVNTEVDAE